LITRRQDTVDRRYVHLEVTRKGREVLHALSVDHARELNELAPRLMRTLADLNKEQDDDES
jgi:DNA-binding MarR family transcriptional regulator